MTILQIHPLLPYNFSLDDDDRDGFGRLVSLQVMKPLKDYNNINNVAVTTTIETL